MNSSALAGWQSVTSLIAMALSFLVLCGYAIDANARSAAERCRTVRGDAGIAACSQQIRLKPNDAVAYYNRGVRWHGKGDYDKATADYDRAIRLNPKFAKAYYNRGHAWHKKSDYDKAIADYTKSIRLNPKLPRAYRNRGAAWHKQSDYDKAIADYDKAIRLNPKHAHTYYIRGNAWFGKSNYDKAIADYDKAIRLNPKHANAYSARGVSWVKKSQHDKAIADYGKAIRLNPKNFYNFYNRGNAWYSKGEDEKAISDYDESIRLNNKHASAYYGRGLSWERKGDYQKAIANYRDCIQLDPSFEHARERLTIALARQKRPATAQVPKPRPKPVEVLMLAAANMKIEPSAAPVPNTNSANGPEKGRVNGNLGPTTIASLAYEDRSALLASNTVTKGSLNNASDETVLFCAKSLNKDFTAWIDDVAELKAKFRSLDVDACRSRFGLSKLNDASQMEADKLDRLTPTKRRVAIVIGNNKYSKIPSLDNPVNDAMDIAAVLQSLGFEVIRAIDADRNEMENSLAEFAKKARSSDVALVFYAGHGIQHEGINYLIPTDGQLTDETDLRRFIKLRSVINDLNNGKGARILIVDACRDNEALTRFAGSLPRTRSMAFTKGLADESAEGVLIAYATQPGKVAVDEVGGRNSPFTAAILKHIKAPDTDIRVMFTRVRKDVLDATDFNQRPEVSDSMIGEFQFARATSATHSSLIRAEAARRRVLEEGERPKSTEEERKETEQLIQQSLPLPLPPAPSGLH